jgi:hypothetical protein
MKPVTKKVIEKSPSTEETDSEDENPDDDIMDDDQPLDYVEDEDVDDMKNPNSGEDHQTKDTVQGGTESVLQAPIEVAATRTHHIEVIAARMWCF